MFFKKNVKAEKFTLSFPSTTSIQRTERLCESIAGYMTPTVPTNTDCFCRSTRVPVATTEDATVDRQQNPSLSDVLRTREERRGSICLFYPLELVPDIALTSSIVITLSM